MKTCTEPIAATYLDEHEIAFEYPGAWALLRGHVFWYGDAIEAGARALCAEFDTDAGLIPPGARDAELYN
jgi:hypothetical protein